jgi:recombination protein RecA
MAAKKTKAKAKAKATPESDIADDVLEGIRNEIGEGGAFLLGDDSVQLKIRGVISTQCPTLDVAIGRGGTPLARLSILHGGEGSGKTTIALHLVAECQQMGGVAVYIDKEYKLDPDYAQNIGVNIKKMIISQPGSCEDVCTVIGSAIAKAAAYRERTGRRVPILVVVDSLNACIAQAVINGEVGDHHIAPEARVWSRQLPQLVEKCAKEDVALVFISQVRKKIGVMFGSDEELAGGNAPKFYASLIMYVRRVGTVKEGDEKNVEKVGSKIEVECRKNQIAPPFKKAKFNIVYGKGVDYEHSLLIQCEKLDLVEKSGTWYSYGGERIGQGIQAAAKQLRSNTELRGSLVRVMRKAMGWDG